MKNFREFVWILAGISMTCFFSVSTYLLVMTGFALDQKLPAYEELWSRGWNDFNSISASIQELTVATSPLVIAFPQLTNEVAAMSESVARIDQSVNSIALTIPQQMGNMSHQMGTMRRNMTPDGMLRRIMPW